MEIFTAELTLRDFIFFTWTFQSGKNSGPEWTGTSMRLCQSDKSNKRMSLLLLNHIELGNVLREIKCSISKFNFMYGLKYSGHVNRKTKTHTFNICFWLLCLYTELLNRLFVKWFVIFGIKVLSHKNIETAAFVITTARIKMLWEIPLNEIKKVNMMKYLYKVIYYA